MNGEPASKKFTICIDFDGVIYSYTSGWNNGDLDDLPVEGAFDFIKEIMRDYDVNIFTSRLLGKTPDDFELRHMMDHYWYFDYNSSRRKIEAWMVKHGLEQHIVNKIGFVFWKLPCHLYIDDRAWLFKGKFPSLQEIKSFKPWYQNEDRKPQHSFESNSELWANIGPR
jgi:hypothetical protein